MKPILCTKAAASAASPSREAGFTMIEVLVSLLVIVLGLLGLAGLQGRMQQAEFESYQRAQALVLMQDMVDRLMTNEATAPCFAFTTDTAAGTPFVGVASLGAPACGHSTAANNAMADAAINEWSALLQGAAEVKGGVQVGAIVGARGCVTYGAGTEVVDSTGAAVPGTGIYTVSVSWQGMSDTFAPTVACAANQYGSETMRRTVSTNLRIAYLK